MLRLALHVASKRHMSSLSAGIVGVPNVGKSTLFNALTCSNQAQASNFPFCTIEPNVGSVVVPDRNIEILSKIIKPQRRQFAEVKIVDIAGLVRGASQNAGLGNKFLEHIRQVDAIIHCVRCFPDVGITHVEGTIDPLRDLNIIDTELILSDLQTLENSIERLKRKAKTGAKEDKLRLDVLERCLAVLGSEKPVRSVPWHKEDADVQKIIKDSGLLTAKPVLYLANIDEIQMSQLLTENIKVEQLEQVEKYALQQLGSADGSVRFKCHPLTPAPMAALVGVGVVPACAQLEAELSTSTHAEREELLSAVGMSEPALATVAALSYRLLGLQSYYTAGEKEVRAWTVPIGSTAVQAARAIHSDIEKGFIRAEVFSVQDMQTHGSEAKVRAAGLVRTEGKGYIVRDDDVVHFLHGN